jgi:dolichyl-phosphate-mannose-protein mannosyltransferase
VKSIKQDWLWKLIIFLGVILRLRLYLENYSFNVDEASIALNIIHRTIYDFTQPLDYNQGAPFGFLVVEKASAFLLGNRDFILRLFPFLAGIFSVYLVYRIANDYFGASGLFAVFLFAIAGSLVFYPSILKQYSSDVMIALLLHYLTLRCLSRNATNRDMVTFAAVSSMSIWFSHPAVFVLAGIGLTLGIVTIDRRDPNLLVRIIVLGCLWAVSFGSEYYFSLRLLFGNTYLVSYWHNDFMPVRPWDHLKWFLGTYKSWLVMIDPSLTNHYLIRVWSLILIMGTGFLIVRNRILASLTFSPFLITSIAAFLQKYPLRDRLVLYLIPFLLLIFSEGVGCIYFLVNKVSRNRMVAVICISIVCVVILWAPTKSALNNFLFPTTIQDIKPVLAYVSKNQEPNDLIYVPVPSIQAFLYYSPFYHLENDTVMIAAYTHANTTKYNDDQTFFDDVIKLVGHDRVWIIFSRNQKTIYIDYLNKFGTMESSFQASDAVIYLYDLKP